MSETTTGSLEDLAQLVTPTAVADAPVPAEPKIDNMNVMFGFDERTGLEQNPLFP